MKGRAYFLLTKPHDQITSINVSEKGKASVHPL